MLDAGLNITIGTDDPSISRITLSDEYHLAGERLGMENKQLQERLLAAAQASFLPKNECSELVKQLHEELRT